MMESSSPSPARTSSFTPWRARLSCATARRIRSLVLLIVLLWAIRTTLADCNLVTSESMAPTLETGDRVLLNRLAYGVRLPGLGWLLRWNTPQRGEIVVLRSPANGHWLVKRVVAGPGDIIDQITVPEGQYFVMGDNRDHSSDSRYFGCVAEDQIVGRVVGIVISMDRDQCFKPRWQRFGSSVP